MTDKQSNQQSDLQSCPPYYEDEINLIDYLRVLWKWKWFIMAGTLVCVVIAAVISLQMPRIYEVSASIEPGIEGDKDTADFRYIESTESISKKIRIGVYNRRIKEVLGLDPLKVGIGFTPTVVTETGTVRVTSQWSEGETDLGKKVTRQLIQFLSDDLEKIIEWKKSKYDRQIELKQIDIRAAQKKRQLSQTILRDTRQQKSLLLKDIDGAKDRMTQLIQQQGALLKGEHPDKGLSLVVYSSMIQDNRAYLNQMRNQAYTLEFQAKRFEGEDYEQTRIINYTSAEIDELSVRKELFRNIAIIEEPEASPYPVKPRAKLIILLVGLASLFIFIFIAFFIESIKKASKKE